MTNKKNYIDFHCHLDYKNYDGKREQMVRDCMEVGFSRLVTVADPYKDGSYQRTKEVLACDDRVSCMVAAHPHFADGYSEQIEQGIFRFCDEAKPVGFGEAGLDFHYNYSKPENQEKVFARQIAMAAELRLPLIIHAREAENRVMAMLEESGFDGKVVFHCYTGNIEDAEEILKRGYYISISGILTFPKAAYLREIVKMIPPDRIFTETDSPYLAPIPFRGKTNAPLYVQYTAQTIAEIKQISVETLNRAVNENFNYVTGA